MVTIIPVTQFVWAVGRGIRYSGGFDAWNGDIAGTPHSLYTAKPWWAHLGPMHLWFLMQLLVLCAAAWVCVQLAQRFDIARSTANFITRGWRFCAARGLACFPLGLLAVVLLFTQNQPMVGTQETPGPPVNILAYYAVFFTAGWLTFGCQASLRGLAQLWWIQLIAGTLLGLVFITLLVKFGQHLAAGEATPQALDIQMRTVGGVATTLLVLGFTGLFLRLFKRPNQTMRWISDSAYWMHIAHLPVVITFQILLLVGHAAN